MAYMRAASRVWRKMFREYFCSGSCCRLFGAWFGLVVFLAHQVFRAWLKWAVNDWYGRFYDVLQTTVERSSGAFDPNTELATMRGLVWDQLINFAIIVSPAVVVHPVAGLIRNWWVFVWRRSIMKAYLTRWDINIPPIEGASQRVHEDSQRFASGIQNCVAIILESVFTLMVFCPVLYRLDPELMAVAIGTALGGLLVSVLVGHKLVGLEVGNQREEAELRKRLVVLEVDPSSLEISGSPLLAFVDNLKSLSSNYWSLYINFAALATWLSTFDQFCIILPYLLTAPRMFAEDPSRVLTLGALMKVTNSFSKVFDSLNIVSENYLALNEWRSVLRRLTEYEREVYNRSPPVARILPGTELTNPPTIEEEDAQITSV